MKMLVCNLKNKKTFDEIKKYEENIKEYTFKNVELIIAPPLVYLPIFNSKNYLLATQDISSFNELTITGEITGKQLKSLGVSYTIVGHSERRIYKHEINIDFINKINHAQENDINVIYCIGESIDEYESGNTYIVLEKQISEVLNNVLLKNICIAYEPIWAIGTNKTPTKEEIEETTNFIKDIIMEKYNTHMKVLYGGSINPENIKEFKNIKNLDGFLVGSASLDIENVKEMIINLS